MPVHIDGQNLYKTREACKLAGTNINTFFRWVRQGKFPDVEYRDRNGWRLFTENDIHRLKAQAKRIYKVSDLPTSPGSTLNNHLI